MLPLRNTLLRTESVSGEMHKFLVNQYRFLSSIHQENEKKVKKLNQVLGLLQGTQVDLNASEQNDEECKETQEAINWFNAKMELTKPMQEFVCKSKYFTIDAKLVSETIQVRPEDKLIVIATLYTAESTPKMIRHASDGRKIFRGNTRVIMENDYGEHLVNFRLQIKEVSSHYSGGVFHLKLEVEESVSCPNLKVQPLVIENLRVRAKEYYVDLMK